MVEGFPSNIELNSIYYLRQQNDMPDYIPADKKEFCKVLLYSMGFKKSDFKIGESKIFLRIGKHDILNQRITSDQLMYQIKKFVLKTNWNRLLTIIRCVHICK